MNAPATPLFLHADQREWEDLGNGVQRQMLGHDEALMMLRIRFEQGAVGTLHHHPHRQASYVESGEFEVEIAGERRRLRAGDAFFIPPDVEHGVVALQGGSLVDVFAPARLDFLGAE